MSAREAAVEALVREALERAIPGIVRAVLRDEGPEPITAADRAWARRQIERLGLRPPGAR